ncbi:Rv3235 family protein [Sediminivirga luteola]|uniref:Rv3235 family protein n=1 Tax=Sediminivirga luteola TaxID=1774748 RepID=UPI001F5892A4|nr:Rv3235 family protein [Sediminivirga luteola]
MRSLAVSVVEALYGLRPAAQLRRWVEPEVMVRIDAHVSRRMELLRGRPERVATVRAGTVVLQRTAPDVLDASVVVHSTVRIRAVALQLRRRRGRWRVSAFLTA